jgi:N-acetylneuraminic acid mutarotase
MLARNSFWVRTSSAGGIRRLYVGMGSFVDVQTTGSPHTNVLQSMDLEGGHTVLPDIPVALGRGVGAGFTGHGFFGTGFDGTSHAKTNWYQYDPVLGTWNVVASIPQGRNSSAVAVVGGNVYVMAGSQVNVQTVAGHLNSLYRYEPALVAVAGGDGWGIITG